MPNSCKASNILPTNTIWRNHASHDSFVLWVNNSCVNRWNEEGSKGGSALTNPWTYGVEPREGAKKVPPPHVLIVIFSSTRSKLHFWVRCRAIDMNRYNIYIYYIGYILCIINHFQSWVQNVNTCICASKNNINMYVYTCVTLVKSDMLCKCQFMYCRFLNVISTRAMKKIYIYIYQ